MDSEHILQWVGMALSIGWAASQFVIRVWLAIGDARRENYRKWRELEHVLAITPDPDLPKNASPKGGPARPG